MRRYWTKFWVAGGAVVMMLTAGTLLAVVVILKIIRRFLCARRVQDNRERTVSSIRVDRHPKASQTAGYPEVPLKTQEILRR